MCLTMLRFTKQRSFFPSLDAHHTKRTSFWIWRSLVLHSAKPSASAWDHHLIIPNPWVNSAELSSCQTLGLRSNTAAERRKGKQLESPAVKTSSKWDIPHWTSEFRMCHLALNLFLGGFPFCRMFWLPDQWMKVGHKSLATQKFFLGIEFFHTSHDTFGHSNLATCVNNWTRDIYFVVIPKVILENTNHPLEHEKSDDWPRVRHGSDAQWLLVFCCPRKFDHLSFR